MKRGLCALLAVLLLLVGCSPELPDRPPFTSEAYQLRAPAAGDMVAEIETSKGSIYVLLFPELAPLAVRSFQLLAEGGHYDGTSFYRIMQDFIIQGGTGQNETAYGTTFGNEIDQRLYHFAGALCTVNTPGEPGTNGGDFYIVDALPGALAEEDLSALRAYGYREEIVEAYAAVGGYPGLDFTDTVFGQVYAGLEVVDAIAAARATGQRPARPVTIKSITVTILP